MHLRLGILLAWQKPVVTTAFIILNSKSNIIKTFFHLQMTGLFIRNVQPHSCLSGVLKLKDQLIKVRYLHGD